MKTRTSRRPGFGPADVGEARELAVEMLSTIQNGRPYVQDLSDLVDQLMNALGANIDADDYPSRFVSEAVDVD